MPGPIEYPTAGQLSTGPFLFQAKFVAGANAAGSRVERPLLKAIHREGERIKKRREAQIWPEPSVYTLVTNATLTTSLRAKALTAVKKAVNPSTPDVYLLGGEEVWGLVTQVNGISAAFPELAGLRDVEEIAERVADREIRGRSRFMLEDARDLSTVFVSTKVYRAALQVLDEHSFAVLTGSPEMGKTAVAHMIALARFDAGWDVFDCINPGDVITQYKAGRRQLFVADDAFGTTEYDPSRTDAWARSLTQLLRRVDAEHQLIWTSRSAPLQEALLRLRRDTAGQSFPEPGKVEVKAGELEFEEKAQMLFRHSRAAGLDFKAKTLVRTHARRIVRSAHFTPDRIRRFVGTGITELLRNGGSAADLERAVERELTEATERMRSSFLALSTAQRVLLTSFVDAGRGYIGEEHLRAAWQRHAGGIDEDPLALARTLDEHFIAVHGPSLAGFSFSWVHPSWRDLVIEHLSEHPEARRAFLTRAGLGGLSLALSTAGGVSGERRFPLLVEREDWQAVTIRASQLETMTSFDRRQFLKLLAEAGARADAPNELKGVIEATLTGLRQLWTSASNAGDVSTVRLYYGLAALADSYQPDPPLEALWNTAVAGALEQAAEQAEDDVPNLPRVQAFFDLIDLIGTHCPRFLAFVGWPADHVLVAKQILAALQQAADLVWSPDIGDEPDDDELTRLSELIAVAERLAASFPELAMDAEEAAGVLESSLYEHRQLIDRHEDMLQERREEGRERDLTPLRETPRARFDIDELFTGL